MDKLHKLALAFMQHEGWRPSTANPTQTGSRSYRNHNPCNLRSAPSAVAIRDGFAVFNSDWEGLDAFKWDIKMKAQGKTRTKLNGESTLRELIAVFAPSSDGNDVGSYLQHVCHLTGFKEDMKLKEFLT